MYLLWIWKSQKWHFSICFSFTFILPRSYLFVKPLIERWQFVHTFANFISFLLFPLPIGSCHLSNNRRHLCLFSRVSFLQTVPWRSTRPVCLLSLSLSSVFHLRFPMQISSFQISTRPLKLRDARAYKETKDGVETLRHFSIMGSGMFICFRLYGYRIIFHIFSWYLILSISAKYGWITLQKAEFGQKKAFWRNILQKKYIWKYCPHLQFSSCQQTGLIGFVYLCCCWNFMSKITTNSSSGLL